MSRIDIVIPTYNRPEKLFRCLKSIEEQTLDNYEVCVIINDSSNYETYNVIDHFDYLKFWFKTMPHNLYVVGAWNYYFNNFFDRRNPEAVLWLVDDVELKSDTLEKAYNCLKTNYPDTDGVIGLKQECPGHPEYTFKWYGQVLLGNKFIRRYEAVNYSVCAPMYKHWFQDFEMYEHANSLNKFKNCEEAVLYHYHPSFIKSNIDQAHKNVRDSVMKQDRTNFESRQKLGLIWGKSWIK